MDKVSGTCNGAVLKLHPCMLYRAGWAESQAVQCRSVSKKPAFLLTIRDALTSNHSFIARSKHRLHQCPAPHPTLLPQVQAEVCCHDQHQNSSLKCLFCLYWLRGYLRILALVAAESHMPDHEAMAIFVECLLSSTPEKLKWFLCSKNPLVVEGARLLLSLGW